MVTELVRLELGTVATLRLDNPPLNLVTTRLTSEMDARLEQVEASPEVRVLVVAGNERAFCAGSDIGEFADLAGRVGEGKLRYENEVYGRLAGLAVPTIAAIEGDALGGGLELALCCDLRVAADGARLGLPEVRLGVIPGSGGTQRLPRIVGLGRAKEMILRGELYAARDAARFGLVNAVVADGEAEATARSWGEQIAARGPLAVREAKRVIDLALELPLQEGQARELEASERVFASADMLEGAAAFREKRLPRFRGE